MGIKELKNEMRYYLQKNNFQDLLDIIEKIIEEISDYQYENIKIHLPGGSIEDMEKKCKMLQKLIVSKELTHEQRLLLLNIYMPFGKDGEMRLKAILKNQDNYKQNITDYQLEYYKKRDKTFNIDCNNLIKRGFCEGDCENAKPN